MADIKSESKGSSNIKYVRYYHPQDYPESRVFGAFSLILIGIIFLLNTTGNLSWAVWWNFLRLWPVWIIIAGINIILSFSRVTKFIASIISFILFVLLMLFAIAGTSPQLLKNYGIIIPDSLNFLSAGSGSQDYKQSTTSILSSEYPNLEKRYLSINMGIGSFMLTDKLTENKLFQMDAKYFEDLGKPNLENKYSNSMLSILFSTKGSSVIFPNFRSASPEYKFDLGESGVMTDLDLKVGAGRGEVSLTGTKVGKVNADVGAGSLEINLYNVKDKINLKVGAGKATLKLNSEVGYKINYKVGVGSIQVNGDTIASFGSKSSVYESGNYSSADQVVDIDVEVGVGSFELNTK